jgi:hypothetical protein
VKSSWDASSEWRCLVLEHQVVVVVGVDSVAAEEEAVVVVAVMEMVAVEEDTVEDAAEVEEEEEVCGDQIDLPFFLLLLSLLLKAKVLYYITYTI